MNADKIKDFVGDNSLTIIEAMKQIDNNAKGIIFIIDQANHLIGSLTDGDIRRWLLSCGSIMANVMNAMNSRPYTLRIQEAEDAIMIMRDKYITAIPIVDDNESIVDICLLSDFENDNKKRKLIGVPVVIMAGGKGSRLYPYTKILPKPLIPIGDTPIVERIMDYYTEFGMNAFYMTVNYKKDMIRSYFDDINPQYQIRYVEEKEPLGTGGGIKLISEKFEKSIFVANCDALILTDYYNMYQFHLKSDNDITMVAALKNFQIPYGVLHTGENGILKSMEEKPQLSYFINTGMYIIRPQVIDLIPENTMFHMTQLVEKVIEKGGKVGTYPISEDSFLDMGELSEMKRMEEKLGIVSSKG